MLAKQQYQSLLRNRKVVILKNSAVMHLILATKLILDHGSDFVPSQWLTKYSICY